MKESMSEVSINVSSGLLDQRIFVDPETYQQELEQIFGRCWLFIGHESQITKPNDLVASRMGEDPILLCRDSSGRARAFLNMCRHRGNHICRADQGNTPSFMRTYHGWTFSTDGRLWSYALTDRDAPGEVKGEMRSITRLSTVPAADKKAMT